MGKWKTIFGNLATLARADVSQFLTTAQLASAISNVGGAHTLNAPGASKPAENSILAYACLVARRDAVASAPIVISRDDSEIESGPLVDLLKNPNPAMDWQQYIRILETHMTFYNVCAILPVGEPGRMPDELVPLHPAGLMAELGLHEPSGTARAIRWRYTDPATGAQRTFNPEEIIIHTGYNPDSPLSALSPLRVLERSIASEICAREQNLATFANSSMPSGYLHTDHPANKEQMFEALQVWNDSNQGFTNRKKTTALWGGLKYDRIQLTPEELEFLESLKALRIDFYMVFRVYPAMLAEMTGETGLSQGSATDKQRVAWWEDVGIPELKLFASMHATLISRWGFQTARHEAGRTLTRMERMLKARTAATKAGVQIWFNEAAIPALARARMAKFDDMVKACNTLGYRPDDMNDFMDMGLPPHPDNLPRMPFSLQVIGEAATEPLEQKDAKSTKIAEEDPSVAALERIEKVLLARAEKPGGSKQKARQAFLAPRMKAAAKRWSRFFMEQRDRVLARCEKVKISRAEAILSRDEKGDVLHVIFPRDDEDMALVARIRPVLVEHANDGAKLLSTEVGLPNAMTVETNPAMFEAVEKRTLKAKIVNDTTEEKLRDIIRDAFETGETTAGLADRIASYYRENATGEDSFRATTAANTQTSGVVNDGMLIEAREVGGLKKYWIHGNPDEPRPGHIAAEATYSEGNAIGLDEKFVVDGEEMDAPGDDAASAANVCNCTCTLGFTKG